MKVKIEFDASLTENEIIIRYCSLNEEIQKLQETVSDIALTSKKFVCYQSDREFFIPLDDILFFETDAGRMHVHTAAEAYDTKFKLYELEEALPRSFMRVSKSTILNTHHVYSITKNLTASSIVEFVGTHKQVYVSRYYYKPLKIKLEEMRNVYEK